MHNVPYTLNSHKPWTKKWGLDRQTPQSSTIAIRFFSYELKNVGLNLTKSRGATGISFVDSEHRDLSGDSTSYTKLTEIILTKQLEGHDRVRRMGKKRLLYQFKLFLENNAGAISPFAEEQCKLYIKKLEANIS